MPRNKRGPVSAVYNVKYTIHNRKLPFERFCRMIRSSGNEKKFLNRRIKRWHTLRVVI